MSDLNEISMIKDINLLETAETSFNQDLLLFRNMQEGGLLIGQSNSCQHRASVGNLKLFNNNNLDASIEIEDKNSHSHDFSDDIILNS